MLQCLRVLQCLSTWLYSNLGNQDTPVVDANSEVLLASLHQEVAEDDVEPLRVADALSAPEEIIINSYGVTNLLGTSTR